MYVESSRSTIRNLLTSIDDVEKWKNQPVTLQIVARPYQDEELIAISEIIDNVCNKS
jgi:Asp-tRNA(Asn)/Glu-tRNA(Gln) amidotransferase A subunit family amidase